MIIKPIGGDEISKSKPDYARLASRLFRDIFQIEQERVVERQRAEALLRQAHDELEKRVEERTAELSKSNALLRQEIFERKQAEEELRKINEELKNFADIVSHDLKTPIMCIQAFSSRLLERHGDTLGQKGSIHLEGIKANANRMERFVSDLLALSKVGRSVATFEDVSSLEIVDRIWL